MFVKGPLPRFRFGFNRPVARERFHEVFPIPRSAIAIIAIAIFDIVFLIPAITTLQQVDELWRNPGDLFSLVSALFITFWLLGWAIAPLTLSLLLAVLLFGREELRAGPGSVTLFLGLPFLGVSTDYDVEKIRNIRIEHPPEKSGRSWRGPHALFDYGSNTIAFGSYLAEPQLAGLKSRLEMATGRSFRRSAMSLEESGDDLTSGATAGIAVPEPGIVDRQRAESTEGAKPVTLASLSVLALIFANCVPLLGAAFWGWSLGGVMILYWAESAVVGFFNLLKIAVIARWMALLAGPFFVGHFGAFMAVHFLFLYTFFIEGLHSESSMSGDLGNVAQLFAGLWPALLALVVSHGYSFFANFIGREEYRGKSVKAQMSEPYSRIVFMHVVLIFGGGLALILGDPTPVLMAVILLKILFDVKAHLRQRQRLPQ